MKKTNSALTMNESVEQVKSRLKFKTSVMVLVIAFLVLVTATLAWFTLSGMAGVSTLDMSVTTGTELEISIDGSNWGKTLTPTQINAYMTANGYGTTLDNMRLQPVSTWDNTSAQVLSYEDRSEVTTDSAKSTGAYLYIPIWIRSSTDSKVFLSAAKFEDTTTGTVLDNGTQINADNTKNGGNAALNEVYKTVRFSLTPASASAAAICYEEEADTLIGGSNPANLVTHAGLGTKSGIDNPAAAQVATVTANTPVQFWLRVWIDGNSAECTNAVRSAAFQVAIAFDSEEIAA